MLFQGEFYYVASESNDVKAYKIENGSYDGIIARFTAGTYHLDISKDGTYLAIGSGYASR